MIYSNNKTPSCMSKSMMWNHPYDNNRFTRLYNKLWTKCIYQGRLFEHEFHRSATGFKFKTRTF